MKPRILVTANAYLPGHLAGGPIRSIKGLVETLADEFEFLILTSDRDLGAPTPYPDVQLDTWNKVGQADVFYMRPQSQTVRRMGKLLRNTSFDLLYLNSFFSPRFSIIPLLAMRLGMVSTRPVLIAPRGEFSAGACGLKKWRKRLYVSTAKLLSLYGPVHWHASTSLDSQDIRRVMGMPATRVFEACELVSLERLKAVSERDSVPRTGPMRLCFLSRISRMKNLDYALRVLARVKTPVLFSIYGPIEDATYWRECERLISELPSHIKVRYEGPIVYDRVHDTLAKNHVLFLPTRGENFGHVLLEAWSAGIPVITSDQTPWRGLIAHGVGWDLPLGDPQRFADAIESIAVGSSDGGDTQLRCVEFASRRANDSLAVEANRAMFRAVLRQCNS